MIYFFLFCIFLFNALYFDFCKKERYKKEAYYIELLLLIMLAGCRHLVGTDTIMYYNAWDELPTLMELWKFDFAEAEYNVLWYVLNAICKSMCDSFTFFQFVQAIFVNVVFFWFFKKYTPYIFAASFFYLCFSYLYFNVEILREVMCVCCFMLLIPTLFEKKWKKYYLGCLIALGFHYSALILFVLPILLGLLGKDVTWKKTLVFGIILALSIPIIFSVVELLVRLSGNSILMLKFDIYTNLTRNLNGMIRIGLLPALPMLMLLIMDLHNQSEERKFMLWRKMVCLSFLFNLSNAWFVIIGSRFANYLEPVFIIYAINVTFPYLRRKVLLQHIGISLFILFLLTDIFLSYSHKEDGVTPSYIFYYPYTSVFSFDSQIVSEREYYNAWVREIL